MRGEGKGGGFVGRGGGNGAAHRAIRRIKKQETIVRRGKRLGKDKDIRLRVRLGKEGGLVVTSDAQVYRREFLHI